MMEASTMETRMALLELRLENAEAANRSNQELLRDIDAKLDNMLEETAKYKGFVGGLLLAGSCLFAFFKIFGAFLAKKLFGA
jgi:hypothetical protein